MVFYFAILLIKFAMSWKVGTYWRSETLSESLSIVLELFSENLERRWGEGSVRERLLYNVEDQQ
jgi:hypothetical protein